MFKFNIILLLAFIISNGSVRTIPVSELAGMHQLDEGLWTEEEKPSNLTICKGKKDGTMISDEQDKTRFYACNNGLAFPFYCPSSLVFNPVKYVCEFDPNSPTKRPPYQGNSTFNCAGKKDGFYPDEKDATKFYECIDRYSYDFQCPPKTIFIPQQNVCAFRNAQQKSDGMMVMTTEQANRAVRELESTTTGAEGTVEGEANQQQSEKLPRNERSANQLEQVASGKHIDLHQVETTTRENFDLLD